MPHRLSFCFRAAVGAVAAIAAAPPLIPAALAQTSAILPRSQTAPAVTLEPIDVIAPTPLFGVGVERDKLPLNIQSIPTPDPAISGSPALSQSLNQQLGSVNIDSNLDNPFQPDVNYRGFQASPVVGSPTGIAVYQNGVRLNDPFGDFVTWSLIPDFAINRVTVIPSNPVYGLNALGGALVFGMKNGFNFQGGELDISGGSFSRRQFTAEWGKQIGNIGAYIGTNTIYDDGFRKRSDSRVRQLYADIGAESEHGSLHINFTGANNNLAGIGPTPIELVKTDRTAVFVSPQTFLDTLAMTSIGGSYNASDALSLQSNFYYRSAGRQSFAGNISNVKPCGQVSNTLCLEDSADILFDANGQAVPDILGGLAAGQNDIGKIASEGLGGSLQATYTAPLFQHDNHLVVGISLDHGSVSFSSTNEVAAIDPSTLVTTGLGPIIQQPNGSLAPIRLDTTNSYYGLYATDTFDVTPRLSVTVGGRYNLALVRLIDRRGTALNGDNRFARFNPSAGATFKITPAVTGYFSYAETNRTPTAGEIGCSDRNRPCSLDLFVTADPPGLRQVVARTYEGGLRGKFATGDNDRDGKVEWNLGLFRTDLTDDILSIPSGTNISTGYFANVGGTRRQGSEASLSYKQPRWQIGANYSLIDATFESALTLASRFNPFADANGNIQVRPGSRLPGIPHHRLKLNADYAITDKWSVGANLIAVSGQYFFGDEANRNAQLPGYWTVNLHSSYKIADNFEMFLLVQNLFDQKYETFGIYGDATRTALPGVPNPTDPRFVSVAPPLAAYGGMRLKF